MSLYVESRVGDLESNLTFWGKRALSSFSPIMRRHFQIFSDICRHFPQASPTLLPHFPDFPALPSTSSTEERTTCGSWDATRERDVARLLALELLPLRLLLLLSSSPFLSSSPLSLLSSPLLSARLYCIFAILVIYLCIDPSTACPLFEHLHCTLSIISIASLRFRHSDPPIHYAR